MMFIFKENFYKKVVILIIRLIKNETVKNY